MNEEIIEEQRQVEMDQFATHIQMLVKYLMVCDGDVLELGSGNYSTPLIHEITKSRGFKADIFDNNEEWLNKFRYLEDDSTSINIIKDWSDFKVQKQYGLAFVDHADPPDHQRWMQVINLIPFSKFIMIHDAEDDQYGYQNLYMDERIILIEEDTRHKATTKVFRVQ